MGPGLSAVVTDAGSHQHRRAPMAVRSGLPAFEVCAHLGTALLTPCSVVDTAASSSIVTQNTESLQQVATCGDMPPA